VLQRGRWCGIIIIIIIIISSFSSTVFVMGLVSVVAAHK
jgi:hypothetical protein